MNEIICGNCIDVMRKMKDECIDLVVTSPPYDNIRDYHGYSFDFETVANELYRVMKKGGVVVWVIGDATVKGSETCTSFKQAIYFTEIGFNLHDTMIYAKNNPIPQKSNRYQAQFEYMFVLSKGKPKTFNPILIPVKSQKVKEDTFGRRKDGELKKSIRGGNKTKYARNIWFYNIGMNQTTKDKIAFKHPAIFPEKLAEDHILSWSNKGDIVYDPFSGAGTTCKMAKLNDRRYMGSDMSEEYCEIARERCEHVD
jgi:site-specific DNA-methyltransferase (adenine-specific)